MASTQQTGFVHSVAVPTIYRTASKIARKVKEGEDSLKNLIYVCRKGIVKKVYALVIETFKRNDIIDELLQKSQLLMKEPRLDVWLAKIIIWDLLWGKKTFKRGCKPIETILNYEKILRELLKDCKDSTLSVLKHDILKPRYIRVNTLKITTEEAVANFIDEGWGLVPFHNKSNYKDFQDCLNNLKPDEFIKDIHIPELLIFPPKTEFHQHEAYKSGCIILQDKASCLPAHLLAPSPGSVVLDTCAAPGMKTTQLAALLQNKGIVYAVEVNPKRVGILKQIVESAGATCVETILKDVMEVTKDACPDVEYILVDPSCSGSGITDRIEIEKSDLNTRTQRLRKLCNFQAKLLRHTMKSFPKVKRIVYSTCSINSEENEDVVRQVLETSREFKLVNAKEKLVSWNTKTSDVYPELGNMCIFATPEEDTTNGFFVAVFERLEDGEKNPYLNYELCKLYDKESRKQNTPFLENTDFESYGGNEDMEQNPIEITHTLKKDKEKKNKLNKKENGNMDPFLENSMHFDYACSKKENKNLSSESLELNLASKEKNKINKLEKEDENTDLTSKTFGNIFKEKKKKKSKNNDFDREENGNINACLQNPSEISHILKEDTIRKKNKKNKFGTECEIIDSPLENSIGIENFSKDEKKKNKKSQKIGKNMEHVLEENLQVEDTSVGEKKKKTKKNYKDDENIDLSNYKMEKKKNKSLNKEKPKNVHIETEISDVLVGKKAIKEKRKKTSKNYELNKGGENANTNLCLENVAEFDHVSKEEKRKKKNKKDKLDNRDEVTDSLLENSIVIENTSKKEKKKKIKMLYREEENIELGSEKNIQFDNTPINDKKEKKNKKKTEKISEKCIDHTLNEETENNSLEEPEVNAVLGHKKSGKKKKRKRTYCDDENIDESNFHIQDTVESKVKKLRRK